MRRRGIIVALAPAMALALLVGACAGPAASSPAVTAGPTPDWRRDIRITADEALGVARAFTGEPLAGARAELMQPGLLTTSYLVDAEPWNIYVDTFAGRVFLASRGDIATGPGPLLAPAEAIGHATAFLLGHMIPAPVVDPEAELVDHGELREWVVTWQGRSGQAFAPDTRRVRLEAVSGEVIGLLDNRLPYTPAPPAAITAERAAANARIAAGMPNGVVESSELWVWFDAAGRQVLVWRVQLAHAADDPYGGAAMIDVDAITGDAVVTGQG